MVNVKMDSGWFLIENKILFGSSVPNSNYINFAMEIGEWIVSEKMPYPIVEYPGEYDIDGIFIKVYVAKDNKLNYVFTLNNKKIWLIQSPKILEVDGINSMDAWIYLDDSVENKIDQLELEWKKFKLDLTEWVLKVASKESEKYENTEQKENEED